MKILVTGGAGFIGSHLCERLVQLGHKVSCIDDFNDFYDPAVKRRNISALLDCRDFDLFEADICSTELTDIIARVSPDIIVHLAARAGVRPSILEPELYEKVNVLGTLNLLEAAKRLGIFRVMFASSSSVYGGNQKVPFAEDDPVDRPVSPYAATKKAGELLCYTYHHLYGMHIFCYRFFTVYGPRQRPEMAIHKFTRKVFQGEPIDIYGDGSSSRDYTYIDDIIDGLAGSLERIRGYEIINLGNSSPTRLLDLIGIIEAQSGRKAQVSHVEEKPGDVPQTFADVTKAKRLLGYRPKTPIKEGIRKFIKWYDNKCQEGL